MTGGYQAPSRRKKRESDDDSDEDLDTSYGSPVSSRNRISNNNSFTSKDVHQSSSFSHSPGASSDRSFNSSRSSSIYPGLSKEMMNESGDLSPNSSSSSQLYPREKLREMQNQSPGSSRSRNNSNSLSPRSSPLTSTSRKAVIARKPTAESSSSTNTSLYVVVSILLTIAIAFVCKNFLLFANSSTVDVPDEDASKAERFKYFEENLKILKNSFPSQTNRFWMTVSASARHVYYQQDPCFPSVILMASHEKNKQLSLCLAKKISKIFSESQGVQTTSSTSIDISDNQKMSSDDQKELLDSMMHSAFSKGGEKSFVISNIQTLSPNAALLLHGFCDGDSAPYQDVMIVLTMAVDDGVKFTSVKEVEGLLLAVWRRGLDMDKLTALMSRIANNPVVVQSEEESVNRLCA